MKTQVKINDVPISESCLFSFSRMEKYLNKLPYGSCRTTAKLSEDLKYKHHKQASSIANHCKDPNAFKEKYCYRYSYTVLLWGSARTIKDIKNGKLKL